MNLKQKANHRHPRSVRKPALEGQATVQLSWAPHNVVSKMKAIICVLVSLICVAGAVAANPPNILIAIADDQSHAHTSFAGCRAVNTPALDRVARQGVFFRNAFGASLGCSPCRASLLTGRHTWQIEQAGTHATGNGDIGETYPRYSPIREFPPPETQQ